MKILTEKQIRGIVTKLSDLQLALTKAERYELEQKNHLEGLRGYEDISYGIKDIVKSIGGQRTYEIYASQVLPFVGQGVVNDKNFYDCR